LLLLLMLLMLVLRLILPRRGLLMQHPILTVPRVCHAMLLLRRRVGRMLRHCLVLSRVTTCMLLLLLLLLLRMLSLLIS
jgi:hypothetical protein